MPSRTRSYLRGLASGYVVTGATILVGLWLTPFSLRFLDREQFAVFTLASDVLMWLGLLELGLMSVLSSRAAQMSGRPNREDLDRLASTTFFGQLVIASAMALIGFGVAAILPGFLSLRPDLRQSAMLVMALMVLGAALSASTQTFSALLIAHQQIYVDNVIRLSLIALRTSLTIALLLRGVGLPSLAIANLAAIVVTSALAVWRVRSLLPGLSISPRHFERKTLNESIGTGIWFSIGGLAGLMIMNLDRLVTAKLVSVATVTTLSLTGKLYALAWSVTQQVSQTARPALAQILGEGRRDLAVAKYRQLAVISTGLAILMAGVIWTGNGAFVAWWVGAENYGGVALDSILATNLVIHSWVLPNRAILVAGLAHVPEHTLCRLSEGLLNVVASFALGSLLGVEGVVLGTAVAALLTSSWYLPRLSARYLGVSLTSLLWEDVVRLAPFGLAMVALAQGGAAMGRLSGSLAAAALGSACTMGGGLVLFFLMVLPREIKRRILGVVV